ncbi:hypothetical protein [Streptomyces sp. CB03911]|uniref:hypothetical protein n=1 Tax=Streptomyces sp. CB03911 TaxID=1804758 RepID=UPI0018FE9463|nr:hypothetical protein [Streptomyces sp. CB03911]
MMIHPYEPQFAHKDWIDNQDRVQAGGANGINLRFHQLEQEFAALAHEQINPIIKELARPEQHLTLVPALTAYKTETGPQPPWDQFVDMVAKPAVRREAHGFMNVALPDGAVVKKLLVTGNVHSSGGKLAVTLWSHDIVNGDEAKSLVTASVTGTQVDPPAEVTISNAANRYFLQVEVTEALESDVVQVFSVRFTYQ